MWWFGRKEKDTPPEDKSGASQTSAPSCQDSVQDQFERLGKTVGVQNGDTRCVFLIFCQDLHSTLMTRALYQ